MEILEYKNPEHFTWFIIQTPNLIELKPNPKMNRFILFYLIFVFAQVVFARPSKRENSRVTDHLPHIGPNGVGHIHFGPNSFYFSDRHQECFRGVDSLNCLVMMANGHQSNVQVDNSSGKVHMNFGSGSFFHTFGHQKCFVKVDYLNCTLSINGEESKVQIDRLHGHRNIMMNIGDNNYHHYHVDPNRHDHFVPDNFKNENDNNIDQDESYSLLFNILRSLFREQSSN